MTKNKAWATLLVMAMSPLSSATADPGGVQEPRETQTQVDLLASSRVYFSGTIVDANNAPIAGAKVVVNGISRTTTTTGYYSVSLTVAATSRYVIDVTKSGRAPLRINAVDSRLEAVDVMRPATTVTINPTQPNRITAVNGSFVDLPANSLVDASGNPATGSVIVTLAHYGPSDMPGDMTAVNTTGNEVFLFTAGAFYWEATSSAGVAYDLKPGVNATAFVSPPSEYGTSMPPCQQPADCQFAAWKLGTDGRWYERGSVTVAPSGTTFTIQSLPTLNNSRTNAVINSAAGFWNIDVPFREPACTLVEVTSMPGECFGVPDDNGIYHPGITLVEKLNTPFGTSFTRRDIIGPSDTFVTLYNLLPSQLGSSPNYQEIGLVFPTNAPATCAAGLKIDSSPRAPVGFPTYDRVGGAASGGGGTTKLEPGLPWGGTGQPFIRNAIKSQQPCRSKVIFQGQE